jgi:hypothetical protein
MNKLQKCTTIIAFILLIYLLYRISKEIRDNFEEQDEDSYVLSLVQEIRHIDPSVDQIVDQLKFYEGNKSYTINKKYVHLCKNDQDGNLYHKNQLVLVLLHEIAHTLCKDIGHTANFNEILNDLLAKAENHGVYNSNIPHVQNYCEY